MSISLGGLLLDIPLSNLEAVDIWGDEGLDDQHAPIGLSGLIRKMMKTRAMMKMTWTVVEKTPKN